ncbi:hypothetical protein [Kordia jejudonensis]|uniref:hypothetical protein n=1 Tax=Kordia jejudonensis TaxID=1348245 RepID=UPI00138E0466|nr:hypothetical protein [Kordia jejudonensis]
MNHLVSLVHSFEHEYDENPFTSEFADFSQDADFTQICLYCQTYISLEYTQHEPVVYSLITPVRVSELIPDTEKQLLSTIVLRKKSRAPPSYTS